MNERTRLEQLMESEKLNAKQFAQEVGIQAGTISNIMSGRNNPSLEVMQRVLNRFRTISSDWLILGSGQMYRANGGITEPSLFDIKPTIPEPVVETASSVAPTISTTHVPTIPVENVKDARVVTKITIFYSDGTFEER